MQSTVDNFVTHQYNSFVVFLAVDAIDCFDCTILVAICNTYVCNFNVIHTIVTEWLFLFIVSPAVLLFNAYTLYHFSLDIYI